MNAGHMGVWGMTRSGKSTWVKTKLIPSLPRVLALDVNREYSRHSQTPGPLLDRGTTAELARYPSKLLDPDLSLAIEPTKPDRASCASLLDLITRLLVCMSSDDKARALPQLTLILDECGDYAPLCQEQLATLAMRGATHLNTRLVVISQRPNLTPATVRGNLDELHLFRLVDPIDVKAVKERAGLSFAERVKRLELRRSILWRATGQTEQPEQPAPPRELGSEQVAHGQG